MLINRSSEKKAKPATFSPKYWVEPLWIMISLQCKEAWPGMPDSSNFGPFDDYNLDSNNNLNFNVIILSTSQVEYILLI